PEVSKFHAVSAAQTPGLELLWRAAQQDSLTAFLSEALPLVLQATAGDFAAIATPEGGRWQLLAQSGPRQALPSEILAEAADREAAVSSNGWLAAPISRQGAVTEILAVHATGKGTHAPTVPLVEALAATLAVAFKAVRTRSAQRRRIQRLEAILEIAQ